MRELPLRRLNPAEKLTEQQSSGRRAEEIIKRDWRYRVRPVMIRSDPLFRINRGVSL